MHFTRITNIEYDYLLKAGGDGLIAFFVTLRFHKKGTTFSSAGRKGTVSLLSHLTGLSRTLISKFLPTLLELKLVMVHKNGNIAVRGRNWTRKNLPRQQNTKLIPIQIGPKFSNTKDYVAFVRVHSNILEQKSRIGRKAEQIQIVKEKLNGTIKTLYENKRSNKLLRYSSLSALESNYLPISTISNLGFYKLLKNAEGFSDNHKRVGHNFKKKLLNRDLICQDRIVWRVTEFIAQVGLDELRRSELKGGFFIGKKGIYYECSPRIELGISPLVGNKKKRVK